MRQGYETWFVVTLAPSSIWASSPCLYLTIVCRQLELAYSFHISYKAPLELINVLSHYPLPKSFHFLHLYRLWGNIIIHAITVQHRA